MVPLPCFTGQYFAKPVTLFSFFKFPHFWVPFWDPQIAIHWVKKTPPGDMIEPPGGPKNIRPARKFDVGANAPICWCICTQIICMLGRSSADLGVIFDHLESTLGDLRPSWSTWESHDMSQI